MSNYTLDFEAPLREIEDKIDSIKSTGIKTGMDVREAVQKLEEQLTNEKKILYENLSRWERVQLARHPKRPYSSDYISRITDYWFELHGDRYFSDDPAMICGIAVIDNLKLMIISQEKGRGTKSKLFRNFGMARPEGYRKALRLMKSAEKFGIPVLTLLDTPGAYPGLEAEERGQGEAIARNILEMTRLKVPIITVVIGEVASGGALGIGVGDKILMLENTWYSVISPESCSSILWRSWEFKERAADALKLTATDMKKMKIVDEIVKEPLGGAHKDRETTYSTVKNAILETYDQLKGFSEKDLVNQRIEKYANIGVVKG